MLFYFGRVKGNFPKEVTLEQDLKGREEGSVGRREGNAFLTEAPQWWVGVGVPRQQV